MTAALWNLYNLNIVLEKDTIFLAHLNVFDVLNWFSFFNLKSILFRVNLEFKGICNANTIPDLLLKAVLNHNQKDSTYVCLASLMGLKCWQHKKEEELASSKNIKYFSHHPTSRSQVTLLEEGAEFLISKGVVFAKEHSLTKSIPPPWFCKNKKYG